MENGGHLLQRVYLRKEYENTPQLSCDVRMCFPVVQGHCAHLLTFLIRAATKNIHRMRMSIQIEPELTGVGSLKPVFIYSIGRPADQSYSPSKPEHP